MYDGAVPSLTALNTDTWATQLLTLHRTGRPLITSDFTGQEGHQEIRRVEVVFFNCPQWGISVDGIVILQSNITSGTRQLIKNTDIDSMATSCDSLVTVNLTCEPTLPVISLLFSFNSNCSWIHLAEISFQVALQHSTEDIVPLQSSHTAKMIVILLLCTVAMTTLLAGVCVLVLICTRKCLSGTCTGMARGQCMS